MDHRHAKRHRSFCLVDIHCDNKTASGLVYNSSRQGLYVLSQLHVHQNQYIEIQAHDQDSACNEKVSISGFVVHQNNNGFGLVFCNPDDAAREFAYQVSNHWGIDQGRGI